MPRLRSRSWLATVSVTACLLTATSAQAQIGTAVSPVNVFGDASLVSIGFSDTSQANAADSHGGVTLFAAYAPNGPLVVRLPFLPPYQVDSDSSTPAPWIFRGVPPATYYVALIYGVVDAPNIPDEAWTPLVVPGPCTGLPGMGLVDRESAGVEPGTVRLFVSAFGGCATSYLVEAGTIPGAANAASFEHTGGVLLSVSGVPPGIYYVRVRGRNQFGLGPYSSVLPVSVPDCPAMWTELGSDLTATVVGHQVTLTWTPPVPAPQVGGPITYYELAHLNDGSPESPPQRILIPVTQNSFSTTVPPGTYAVGLFAGNSCRSDAVASVLFNVP
jgi:hypothetical protein